MVQREEEVQLISIHEVYKIMNKLEIDYLLTLKDR